MGARIARLAEWFGAATWRLLAYGLVVAALGTFELARVHEAPWTIQSGRADSLDRTLYVLEDGGPILTSRVPGQAGLNPSGSGDDPGLYLFVPQIARLVGTDDPVNVLRWMCLLAFALTIALYPLLVRGLTGSAVGALIAPVALVAGLFLMPLGDIYWVGSWAILTLVPLLLLLDRRWPRWGLAALVAILVLASTASLVRGQAGLPVLLGAILVVVARPWSRPARAGAVVLCLVAYVSVSSFGLEAAKAYRDHQLDGRELVGGEGHGHPLWHNAYIGLGYLRNDWDIRYFDGVAYRDVLRENPKATFLGPAYSRILRERYFELLTGNPGFSAKTYLAKLVVAIRPAAPGLLIVALVWPWMLLTDPRRRRWRRDGLFLAGAAVISLAPPLIATPYSGYLLGWLPAVLLAAILAAAVAAEAILRAPRPRRLGEAAAASLREGAGRIAVGAGAATIVVLAACAALAPGIEESAADWQNSAPPPRVHQPPDATE